MCGFCGRRARRPTLQAWDFFAGALLASPRVRFFGGVEEQRFSSPCQSSVSRRSRGTTTPLSIERTARLTPGFRQSTRSYGRFSLLAMSVIDQETHIKTSSAAAASPRRRPASFRVSRYVVSKNE